MKSKGLWAAIATALLLTGCSAKTYMHSTDPTLKVSINKDSSLALSNSISRTYSTTSFGQYHFKARNADGAELYGLMPLKFNHGYLVADILFFAPATFFNLREVFQYYEFDVDAGELRYKQQSSEPWSIYKPTLAEAERAKQYFATPR